MTVEILEEKRLTGQAVGISRRAVCAGRQAIGRVRGSNGIKKQCVEIVLSDRDWNGQPARVFQDTGEGPPAQYGMHQTHRTPGLRLVIKGNDQSDRLR